LDFGIDCQIDGEKQLVQSEVLPSKILQLAGNLGLSIELSLYARNMHELMERIHDRELPSIDDGPMQIAESTKGGRLLSNHTVGETAPQNTRSTLRPPGA
jgi:hypothetical protein